MEETTYKFRELCSTDIFPIFSIIKKIGFKQFKDCFQSDAIKDAVKGVKNKDDSLITNVGITIAMDIAAIVLDNVNACEADIYKLLSSVSNLSTDEVKKLSIADFAQMIIDFVKKPDFGDFFKVVSKLFK